LHQRVHGVPCSACRLYGYGGKKLKAN